MLKLLKYISLGLSIILTLAGLASIVDAFIVWARFFAEIIDLYKNLIREPLAYAVDLLWPDAWPDIPRIVFDILIIWISCFTALRLFLTLEEDGWKVMFRDYKRPLFAQIKAFLLGPLLIPYYSWLWASHLRYEETLLDSEKDEVDRGEVRLTNIGWWALETRTTAVAGARQYMQRAFTRLGLYYFGLLAAFILILFVNYQLLKASHKGEQKFGINAPSGNSPGALCGPTGSLPGSCL